MVKELYCFKIGVVSKGTEVEQIWSFNIDTDVRQIINKSQIHQFSPRLEQAVALLAQDIR